MIQVKDSNSEDKNGLDREVANQTCQSRNDDSSGKAPHAPPLPSTQQNQTLASQPKVEPEGRPSSQQPKGEVLGENKESQADNNGLDGQSGVEKACQNLNPAPMQVELDEQKPSPIQAGGAPNGSQEPDGQKDTKDSKLSDEERDEKTSAVKDQNDITMSHEDEHPPSPRQTRPPEPVQKEGSPRKNKIKTVKGMKALELLKQLRSFVSNPSPNFKCNFNNNVVLAKNTVQEFTQSRKDCISLVNQSKDPYKGADLQRQTLDNRFEELQKQSLETISPDVFNSVHFPVPSSKKPKVSRTRSTRSLLKHKTQSVTFQSKIDLSSDDKDSVSKRSAYSDSSNRASVEKRSKRLERLDDHLSRNISVSDLIQARPGTQNLDGIQMKPKEISDRSQNAFEDYLFQVNSMYFCFGLLQPAESLNEVTLRLSGAQSGALGDPNGSGLSMGKTGRLNDPSNFTPGAVPTTLDMLCNPLRVNHIFEDWSPREIATFESCMCRFGKNFGLFTKFIRSKTTKQIVDFYQCWKTTSHFKIWQQKMESSCSEDRNEWVFVNST